MLPAHRQLRIAMLLNLPIQLLNAISRQASVLKVQIEQGWHDDFLVEVPEGVDVAEEGLQPAVDYPAQVF
jgi:hypothetical protein